MAAPSPAAVVFRPRKLRVVTAVASTVLILVTLIGWFALPEPIRDLFTWSQRVTLLGVLGALVFTMWAVGSSYVRADAAGLTVRNGLLIHRIDWDQVHNVLLRPGDPWAMMLVRPRDGGNSEQDGDVEKRQLMGIQRGDGAAAQRAVEELRRRRRAKG